VFAAGMVVLVCVPAAWASGPLVWHAPQLIDGTATSSMGGLRAVSCASATLCVVAGGQDILTSTDAGALSPSWKRVTSPISSTSALPASLSCPSKSLCVLVGGNEVMTSTDPTGGRSAWKAFAVNTEDLSSVSCPAVSLCVAAGASGTLEISTDPAGGPGAWTTVTVPTSTPSECGKNGAGEDCVANLTGVSCPTRSLCVAIDSADNSEGDVITSRTPTLSGAWNTSAVDRNDGLTAVSCPLASLCVAADYVGDLLTSSNPRGGRLAWKTAHVDYGSSSDYASLPRVACGSWELCVTTGGNIALASNDPTGGASAWSAFDLGAASVNAVSCWKALLCAAVDDGGSVIVGTRAPTGRLTGAIRLAGGPAPPPGQHRKPLAGTVSVFTASGRLVARQTVRAGRHFNFELIPGRYLLNAGRRLRYKRPQGCPPAKALVRSSRTTHVDVSQGCDIP
jgi:hypothetical protein